MARQYIVVNKEEFDAFINGRDTADSINAAKEVAANLSEQSGAEGGEQAAFAIVEYAAVLSPKVKRSVDYGFQTIRTRTKKEGGEEGAETASEGGAEATEGEEPVGRKRGRKAKASE